MNNLEELLENCSKDQTSFSKLKHLFSELLEEKESLAAQLNLLERAISSDYDSILITTLQLEEPGPEIVYVNNGFTKMTGYSREEAIGKTPRMLQGPKTDRTVLDKLKQRLKEGQAFFGHTVNYRKDGSEFINQWDIHPLTNERGEITHWVSYQHDITERKRSEKKVLDSQLEFDRLEEESKKTLVDIDIQGNIITSNKAFRDLVGFDEDELKTRKIWNLLEDEKVESFKHKFDKFKPSDFNDITFELKLSNKFGNLVETEVKTRLLSIDDQTVIRASFENKSLQKRIMAMLRQRDVNFEKMFDITKDFRYKISAGKAGSSVILSLSDTYQSVTGFEISETKGLSLQQVVHTEDLWKLEAHLEHVRSGRPNTEQYRIKTVDGFINVIDYAKPVWNEQKDAVIEIKGSISTEISSEAATK
ncbi:MAG: PAS domain S-box protein [Balneolaceae bacterium]|nr:MAG: PAS domain S-box protein [Balneolaceae bacterium]